MRTIWKVWWYWSGWFLIPRLWRKGKAGRVGSATVATVWTLFLVGILGAATAPTEHTAGHAVTKTPAALVLPTSAPLTKAQKQRVALLLDRATTRYANALATGQVALGKTQYASASAGLAALNDPNSAASRFSEWQKIAKSDIYNAPYLATARQVDAIYNAGGPDALTTWENDMGNLGADLQAWTHDAVSWQVGDVSTSRLQRDARLIQKDLRRARADTRAVIRAS